MTHSHPCTRNHAMRTTSMNWQIENTRQQDGFFVLEAEISNGDIDSHGTRMDKSSLRNFAADAKAGVVVNDSHNCSNTGYGRSFDAEYRDGKVLAKIRIPDTGEFEGMTHRTPESLMNFIRKGQINSVSVGFYDETLICDNCSDRMESYGWCERCQLYLNDKIALMINVEKVEKRMTATIVNARLGEISFVGTPSNPNTKIIGFDRANKDQMRQRLDTDFEKGIIQKSYYHTIRSRFGLDEPQPEPESQNVEVNIMEKELQVEMKRSLKLQKEVDDLQSKNSEQAETIQANEKTIAERDAQIAQLQARAEILDTENVRVREQCIDIYKERGTLAKTERSESDIESYQAKIQAFELPQLRAELKDQREQRDIYKKIHEPEPEPEAGTPEPETTPEPSASVDEYAPQRVRHALLSGLKL